MPSAASDVAPIIDAFVSALHSIPSARAHVTVQQTLAGLNRRTNFVLDATVAAKAVTILVEARTAAFPRDVSDAVRRWRAQTQGPAGAPDTLRVLIADTISLGARTALRTNGIGYFDRSGSLYLPTRGAFIYIDCLQPSDSRPTSSTIFSGRKAQVVNAVLEHCSHWVSVKEIAAASGVSAATVSQTLMDIERRGWMKSRGGGPVKLRRLTGAGALLDAWLHDLSGKIPRRPLLYNVPIPRAGLPPALAEVCERHGVSYAVTGERAASLYLADRAGAARTLCRMVGGLAARQAMSALGAHAATEDWNLGVIEAVSDKEIDYARTIEGVRHSSAIQAYLDIAQYSEFSADMLAEMRRRLLGI